MGSNNQIGFMSPCCLRQSWLSPFDLGGAHPVGNHLRLGKLQVPGLLESKAQQRVCFLAIVRLLSPQQQKRELSAHHRQ